MNPPRDDIETTSATAATPCPMCGAGFHRIRRQRFCSAACRQAAWRARHDLPPIPAATAAVTRPTRRDVTVYTCPECEQRYLGQQWCPDCNRPCTRVGVGGLCPECEHPVALDDLLDQHQNQAPQTSKIR